MFTKFNKILKDHYFIVLFSISFGLFCSLPQYFAKYSVPDFQGVYNLHVGDYTYYETRVRDQIDGHTFLSNPYFFEHKNGFPMQTWLTDYIMAKTIAWSKLSVPVGFMVWDSVCVVTLLLLTYALLFNLTASKKWSILGVLFLYISMFGNFLYGIVPRLDVSLFGDFFLRLPSPGFNFIFWLTTALFILLYIKNKKMLYGVLASISFGFLFYVYPYYWTFFVVLLVIYVFLLYLFKSKDISYISVLYIFGGGLIIGIPYFIVTLASTKIPYYAESLTRLGMIHSHFPSGLTNVAVGAVLVICLVYLFKKKYIELNSLNIFLFSGVLGAIIVLNQHIITGKNLEFVNHYFFGNTFWFIFVVIYLLTLYLKNKSFKFQNIVFYILLTSFSFVAMFSLVNIYEKQTNYGEKEIYRQNYMPIYNWLEKNTTKDSVVYANDDISELIPVYTANNVYYSPFGILFFLSDKEAIYRYIISHYFDKFDRDYITKWQRWMFGGYYINEYGHNMSKNKLKKILGLKQEEYALLPENVITNIQNEAEEIQELPFEEALKKYRVDYVIWDKNKNSEWKMDKFKFIEQVYLYNNIYVYKIK
jgi:hypothetical protein